MSPEELRERLERAGLTPYRLSYLLDVEPNEGSKWTRGDRPVPKGRVARIIELTDFIAEHGAAAVPFPALVRTANARPRLVHPAVTRPEPVVSPHSPSIDGRPSRPVRNCDRRPGRASARFTPTSFAPIISPASAALRDKARDPFSGSFDGVCNRPLHPSRRVLVPFPRQQRNPQKLGDDRAVDPMRVPTRLRKVRPDDLSAR